MIPSGLLLDGARLWSFHEQIERGQMAAIRGAKASRCVTGSRIVMT